MVLETLILGGKRRKGLDKSVWLVGVVALMIMFIALYYGAVSGWLTSGGEQVNGLIQQGTPSLN